MGKDKKLRVPRSVRGTTLTFDSLGRPKAIRTVRGPSEMAELRKTSRASMLEQLRKSSLQERDIIRTINGQVGVAWEVQDEHDDAWNQIDLDVTEGWVADEPAAGAVNDLMDELHQTNNENIDIHLGAWARSKRVDNRTRSDRLLRQQEAWATIYSDMTDSYLQWDCAGPPQFDEQTYEGECYSAIKVFDIFASHSRQFPVIQGLFFVPTMVRHGYLGNSPLNPSCAFSLQLLELFRVMNSRCPQFSLHRFVRGLCDLQQDSYAPYLHTKFSSTYDAYLEIVRRTSQRIDIELGRNVPNWQLSNACPACTFKTPNEPPMKFSMLIALDGNNSLRRIPKAVRKRDVDGRMVVSEYTERADGRSMNCDLYLSNVDVDEFKNEVKRRSKTSKSASQSTLPDTHTSDDEVDAVDADLIPTSEEGSPIDGIDRPTPCVDRWTNLADEMTKKMWGIFHETGIFLSVCRHGTALLLCDMVRSGELAKYPLAIINKLVDVYGQNLMIGYDIGCGFATTADRSPKIGPKIRASQTRFCVGSFHGHAHCRLCQLDWHPLYIEGCGLEDFETCERCFSESNAVAGSTRHASTFHRRQAILNHFNHWNMDKYAEISQFIVNNYKQALRIIKENTGPLMEMMKTLDIRSPDKFVEWLHEEKVYLVSLKKPPESDYQSLCIQYVKTLKKLDAARVYFEVTSRQWVAISASSVEQPDFYLTQSSTTQSLEALRLDDAKARGLDSVLTLQAAVRDLEIKLGIEEGNRWTPQCHQWVEAEASLDCAEYQSAIDKLESLVVARLFELLKLNQSGIGVKMRTHIAKALKARSKAIRKAVGDYNAIAAKFGRPHLEISTILQYVALGEFDLLRESRYDISTFPWMRPAERAATLLHLKLQRAREEIVRLNVEVKRLYSYMQTEEKVWEDLILRLQNTEPHLAFQATKHLKHLLCLNQVHETRLIQLELLSEYSGPRQVTRDNHRARETAEDDEDEESDNEDIRTAMDATLLFVDKLD